MRTIMLNIHAGLLEEILGIYDSLKEGEGKKTYTEYLHVKQKVHSKPSVLSFFRLRETNKCKKHSFGKERNIA